MGLLPEGREKNRRGGPKATVVFRIGQIMGELPSSALGPVAS